MQDRKVKGEKGGGIKYVSVSSLIQCNYIVISEGEKNLVKKLK